MASSKSIIMQRMKWELSVMECFSEPKLLGHLKFLQHCIKHRHIKVI